MFTLSETTLHLSWTVPLEYTLVAKKGPLRGVSNFFNIPCFEYKTLSLCGIHVQYILSFLFDCL
jgi:hypothetical protein